MKISIALLAAAYAQEEEAVATEAVAVEESADSGDGIARFVDYRAYDYSNYGDYGEYYYDALGNKKKKNKKKQHHHHNKDTDHSHHVASDFGAHGSQAAWSNSVNSQGAHFGYGKGFQFDQDLIGNGRFCWNCYARLHYNADTMTTTAAYDNCFNGGLHEGFMEMCIGEEYYCSWEERRYKGVIVAVSGGCKSAQSCLRQMTENFRWGVYSPGSPMLRGNLCKSGNFGDETQNSVCAWCCDGYPSNLNRFEPAVDQLCNHKDFTNGPGVPPAHVYFDQGDTNNFVWNQGHGVDETANPNDLFNGLYKDGQYHGLFRIHDQYPLGGGISGPPANNQVRGHPRGWTGSVNNGQ